MNFSRVMPMHQPRRVDTITDLDRAAWNTCFPGDLEDYDYFLAIERAEIAGFRHAYYVLEEAGNILCALPAFFTAYDLSTTAEGIARRAISKLNVWGNGWLTLRLACLGSPETERLAIGFAPQLAAAEQARALADLIQFFKADARAAHCAIMGIKDLSDDDRKKFHPILTTQKFHSITSMPTAYLPIHFNSIDAYLKRFSRIARKDMRRKLKLRSQLRIEYRNNIDDILPAVQAMYLETKNRSDWQFEELTEAYFKNFLACMGSRGLCVVYYLDNAPIAANMLLMDDKKLLDKFFCMRNDGRRHNLYFISWFVNLELCLARGLKLFQCGQAGYDVKLRLGSKLSHNWLYFQHQNWLVQKLLVLLSPIFAFKLPNEKSNADRFPA